MEPITIPFIPTSFGRVDFDAEVSTGDRLSLDTVTFKLDTGSDVTTLCYKDLTHLGYTDKYLRSCRYYGKPFKTAGSVDVHLQCLDNISLKFGDREIQHCCILFLYDDCNKAEPRLRNLFGGDILKYFNYDIDYDRSLFCLRKAKREPKLLPDEVPLQIYTLERAGSLEAKKITPSGTKRLPKINGRAELNEIDPNKI